MLFYAVWSMPQLTRTRISMWNPHTAQSLRRNLLVVHPQEEGRLAMGDRVGAMSRPLKVGLQDQ